jgi:predicted ATPase
MRKAKNKTLRFSHIYLENWRNFAKVDVDLQRRAFLVGPNASGKSNLLDVLRFLHEIVSVGGGFQDAVQIKRGGVSSLRCLAARRYSDIVIKIHIGNDENPSAWEYELHFNQDRQRQAFIKKEKVVKEGSVILTRPDEEDKQDRKRLTQTHLEQVYANQRFRDVADFFSSVCYMHIVPQLVREPDRSVGRTNDPYGGDFLEQIAHTPSRTQGSRLRRIRDTLKVAVPQLQDLELKRDDRGTPHLRGKYEHWRHYGAWQNEEQLSDGTLRLMGLLWAVLEGTGPLLLEEPELSLHPEVIRFIPQMFARIQRRIGRQVLISTHSPDLLRDDGIGLDEVLLLQPASEGTSVRAASSFEEIKELLEGGLNLGDVVMPLTRPKDVQQLTLFGE